jgi:hypothetical protein
VLQSPTFNTATHPRWREAIKQTWSYLTRYYDIHGDEASYTSLKLHCNPDFAAPVPAATQFKRIAQAIIHFEPVLDLSMPDRVGSRVLTRRNWRDNPLLGRANQTQAESIALIEDIPTNNNNTRSDRHINIRGSPEAMVSSILGHNTAWAQTQYTWYLEHSEIDVITFTKPLVCERGEDAILWSDLILSFLRAAVTCPSPARLQRIAMNHYGLRYFLSGQLGITSRKLIQGVWWHVDIRSGQPVMQPHPQARVAHERR